MVYKKNYLTNVIFRLDYDHVKDLDKQDLPAISEILKKEFPIKKYENEKQFEFLVSDKGHSLNQEFSSVWKFISSDEKKVVKVTPRYLVLEYFENSYSKFEELKNIVTTIYNEFLRLYSDSLGKINRLSLRYVNQIALKKGNPFDWAGYINQDLITAVKPDTVESSKLQRSMHQLSLKKNDASVVFTYGMYNSEFPNPIAKKEFLLDLDCFALGNIDSDLSTITGCLSELNEIATRMFEDSIDDELRLILSRGDENE